MSEALRKVNEKLDMHMKFSTFKKYAKELGVYESNQSGKGIKKNRSYKHSLEEIFNSDIISSSYKLKNRLIKEGYKKEFCEECLLSEWQGQKIPLELHHKDGNKNNNNLDNLQLLCPNCHSLTDNFRGKNKKNISNNI